MAYASEGTLTTDTREIAISETWDSQTDWEAYQSKSLTVIENGVVKLEQLTAIDDFEDGDISEYQYNTGVFTVQTSTVQHGTYALQCTASSNNSHITSYSGLGYYPQQGDTFRFWVQNAGSGYTLMYWAAQQGTGGSNDRPDGYAAFIDWANDGLKIRKRSNGSNNTLNNASYSYSGGTWYEVEVAWGTDGSMTVTLYDTSGTQLQQVSATDTEFTSGGITWQTNNGTYIDYLRLV